MFFCKPKTMAIPARIISRSDGMVHLELDSIWQHGKKISVHESDLRTYDEGWFTIPNSEASRLRIFSLDIP